MQQQVGTSIDMAVRTTELTDYNIGVTWLIIIIIIIIIIERERANSTICISNSDASVLHLVQCRTFFFFLSLHHPQVA